MDHFVRMLLKNKIKNRIKSHKMARVMLPRDVLYEIWKQSDFREQLIISSITGFTITSIPGDYGNTLTDEILQRFPNLISLNISHNLKITGDAIGRLKRLQLLNISVIRDFDARVLLQLPELRVLDAHGVNIRPEILAGIKNLKRLAVRDRVQLPKYIDVWTDDRRYAISTYAEWIRTSPFDSIIITDVENRRGYFRWSNRSWMEITDFNMFFSIIPENTYYYFFEDQVRKYEDDAIGHHRYGHYYLVEYNKSEIMRDILETRYFKTPKYQKLQYHEFIITRKLIRGRTMLVRRPGRVSIIRNCFENYVLNTRLSKLVDCRDFFDQNIICRASPSDIIIGTDKTNIDKIDALIPDDIKKNYHRLVRRIFIQPAVSETFNIPIELIQWIQDTLYALTGVDACRTSEYHRDKNRFIAGLNDNRLRLIIMDEPEELEVLQILGFRNFVVPVSSVGVPELPRQLYMSFIDWFCQP